MRKNVKSREETPVINLSIDHLPVSFIDRGSTGKGPVSGHPYRENHLIRINSGWDFDGQCEPIIIRWSLNWVVEKINHEVIAQWRQLGRKFSRIAVFGRDRRDVDPNRVSQSRLTCMKLSSVRAFELSTRLQNTTVLPKRCRSLRGVWALVTADRDQECG